MPKNSLSATEPENRFYNRRRKEYIASLQQRPKWKTAANNIQTGDVVLLTEDSKSPGSWPIGYIVEAHPGKDSLVRVVTRRNSILIRLATKVAILPIYQGPDIV